MKILKEKQVTITVERPNGGKEVIDITAKVSGSEEWFKKYFYPKMVVETQKAGRGNIISYTFCEEEYEKEEHDYIVSCERCAKKIDTRTAYGQKEWTRFNGQKKQVIAYYCKDCHDLLGMIGLGEITAMDDRSANVSSQEMQNKEELV
jgi:hypothetical protein